MTEQQQEMSDDEAIMKIAQAMKDNSSNSDDRHNVHTFLNNVVLAKDSRKIANLREDKELSELGYPDANVRACFDLARISDKIMGNDTFKEYFEAKAENTLATSLSREGFLVRQGTTQTKQVADITKRRSVNKGWFGSKKVNETGGDTTGAASN